MFLFPHTEPKADEIFSWAEITLWNSEITFLHTFQKLEEQFAQLTVIGKWLRAFNRRSGRGGCGWLLCSERELILVALNFLSREASIPPRESPWHCL